MAKRNGCVGVAAACVVAWAAAGAMGVSVIPSEGAYVRDLGGTWRFKLEQKDEAKDGKFGGGPRKFVPPARLEPFERADYKEGAEWKGIRVPGNWEMEGWSVATYNQPDNVVGLYRLEFEVPKEWEGRVVKINFDGVQNGAEVYCNGRPVKVDEPSDGRENYHQGGFDAFQADLTPVVKYGGKNLLAVRVYKNTPVGVELDTGDYFFLGGIHRKVTLFAVPRTHVETMAVKTKVMGDKAELRVILDVAGKDGAEADVQLGDFGKMSGKVEGGKVEVVQTLDHPKLWSAEKPNLYDLNVDLKDADGRVVEHVTRRVGVREVSIEGGVLMVNHVPVKFTGMCRHENYPTMGTAVDESVWRKDIEMMKAANVNAIRTSHYPYGSGFYDLCDELGMYVMDEMAACWVPTDQKRLTATFAQHAREVVRRDRNHPSVIVWAVGNENKKGFNNKVAAEEMRKLDDTRPRLVSWHDAEEGGVELDDRHYTDPKDIQKANDQAERRKTYPMIYLENPNDWEERSGADWGSLDLWGEVIKRTWDVVWEADHVPGSFLWEWADRAVADPNEVHLYDYYPKTGINIVKVKGQVDGYRNARPGLYSVKMAYAPVKVDLTPVVEGDGIVVHARNYYSFTDLGELKTTWTLVREGKDLKSGVARVSLAPRSKGDLKFEISKDEIEQADAVRVAFDAADGGNVATYLLRLRPEGETGPKLAGAEGVRFPRLNLVTVTYGSNPKTGWRMAMRHRASLRDVRVNGRTAGEERALYAMPLGDVREMDAAVVVDGEAVGKVHAGYAGGKFAYRVEWTADQAEEQGKKSKNARKPGRGEADVQELGWVFGVPKEEERFSWKREGLWSWYPEDHIGRLAGTATPDSAEQEVTHITRPDAFDFTSTKYGCEWATMLNDSGEGVGVRFDKDQRHQVRGGTAEDGGGRELVVNLWCCPPRDISSSVVPDLYLTMEKGKVVEGAFGVGRVGK